jgi:protein TonB
MVILRAQGRLTLRGPAPPAQFVRFAMVVLTAVTSCILPTKEAGVSRTPPGARVAPPSPPQPSADQIKPTAVPANVSCGWPPRGEDLDEARVEIAITVAADGTLSGAEVSEDPGHGFGEAALDCARRFRWIPAHDRAGRAISGQRRIYVRFRR